MAQKIIIVGASQAGIQLAASLRGLRADDDITVVGAEPFMPYQRPPLSKALHIHDDVPSALHLRLREFFDTQRIALRLGERVVDVDRRRGFVCCASGDALEFSRLALTVGARARRLCVPGDELAGIYSLRSYADALLIGRQMPDCGSVVVIGAGLIGMEVAALSRRAGKTVTVVEKAPSVMHRVTSPLVSQFILARHRSSGVDFVFGSSVERFCGRDGKVDSVVLDNGTVIAADLVVIGIGSEPRTELALSLGLECDGGVVIDEAARTSVATVVAAGDCTVERARNGARLPRSESVSNAIAQAKIAAATLSGTVAFRNTAPWFWSDQGLLRLQSAGATTAAERIETETSADGVRLTVRHFAKNRLVGIECVNSAAHFMAGRRLLDGEMAEPVGSGSEAFVI